MRVLVFGEKGQVASSFKKMIPGYTRELESCEFIFFGSEKANFANSKQVISILEENRPQIIVNTSAYTLVDKAESEKDLCMQINASTVGEIADWCKQNNCWLIHYSSDYVFDGSGEQFRNEEDVPSPLSTYGLSKLKGDELIQKSKCQYYIFRTSWVYSEFGNNFVKTMLKLGAEREELKIVSDQVGAPTFASDIAEYTILAIIKILKSKAMSGVYNLVNSGTTSWYGFAVEIFAKAKEKSFPLKVKSVLPITTDQYPTPAKRPHNSRLWLNKLENHFEKTPQSWQLALDRCLACMITK